VSGYLLLGVSKGERPLWGLVCSLPPRWVLIAHRLLGEEGLGDRGGELEGAGLGQLRGPRSLCTGGFVNLSRVASPGAHVTAKTKAKESKFTD
jgi:hypothetical protein